MPSKAQFFTINADEMNKIGHYLFIWILFYRTESLKGQIASKVEEKSRRGER